jgi:hypothetical protein
MPALPSYPSTNSVFIETTELTHEHGGSGWEFGTCLWSPTVNAAGHKTYKLMREPMEGDLVIHILKDYDDGKSKRSHFTGFSYVSSPAEIGTAEPPSPGTWADRGTYYRIGIRTYTPLDPPVRVDRFLEDFETELRTEIDASHDGAPHYLPFTINRNMLRLNQGMYLTRCTPLVFSHLGTILQLSRPSITGERPGETQALQEFSEGRRSSAERQFFARNPALVKAAKQRYGYKCQACDFDFAQSYGDLGDRYIEAHSLNPLSERDPSLWNENLTTSTDDIRVVCSNCHRMIHRRKPPLLIEQLREILRAQAS